MIIYTFITFPGKDELNGIDGGGVFVFSKLKKDFAELKSRLLDEKHDYVVGIALLKGRTRIEPTAINRFNNGAILAGRQESLDLFVPDEWKGVFETSKKPTRTFCNWTMY